MKTYKSLFKINLYKTNSLKQFCLKGKKQVDANVFLISPLDGRYRTQTDELRKILSKLINN